LPSIHSSILPKPPKATSCTPAVPKASTSRATKKLAAPITKKPTLTKKGQGSFSVLGEPTSKVTTIENNK